LRSLFLIAASVALIAQMAVLRSVVIGRAPASAPGRTARFAEIAWVAIPTIVLAGVFFLTWRMLGEPVALAPVNGVTV
jgi:heme/copper-type cytochrome/quinol oxidase subunit 2